MVHDQDFGELLSRFRAIRGLTQEELAELAGLSARGISDLERGARRSPHRETVRRLARALGLAAPELEMFQLAARRRQSDPAITMMPVDTPVSNLPVPPTPFIGRHKELDAIFRLIRRAEVRLLTLTGTGGTGKTRLAIHAAALAGDFRDGVCFVPLAPVTQPDLVGTLIADAAGIRERGSQSLFDAMQHREQLLVLDNFEHLLAAAPVILALLASGPKLKVLVTSRAPLGLSGEYEFPVLPFPLPDPDADPPPDVDELARFEVVQLFVQRASAVVPDFTVTPGNIQAITEIAIRLDGLPLAIELAATRSKLLSPGAIAGRLERRLPLLTGGAIDLPVRHRTLRATIAWSYELLDRESRRVFRRLSVFAGGFNLDAAMTMGRETPGPEAELAMLDKLGVLVDRSLLLRQDQEDGEPRFTMLETLREFGQEQLDAAGEGEEASRAHLHYALHLAEEAEPHLTQPGQDLWYRRLTVDFSNLRAALQWAVVNDPESGLRLASALNRFWEHRSYVQEGQRWLEAALAALPGAGDLLRAKALWGLGVLYVISGSYDRARDALRQSLDLAHVAGSAYYAGFACNGLGSVSALQGELERARDWHQQGLDLLRVTGDLDGIAALLGNLGTDLFLLGHHDQAFRALEESLHLYRELRSDPGIGNILVNLGRILLLRGDAAGAQQTLREGLEYGQRTGNTWYVVQCLSGLAGVAVLNGNLEMATQLFGTVENVTISSHFTLPAWDLAAQTRYLAQARRRLDEDDFTRSWNAGCDQSLAAAIALGLR